MREQQGAEVFDIIERIRLASIRFHRDNEVSARRELAAILDSLDADQTLTIVRAFSYFSHLSNIAEDQHHIRRNRAHVLERSPPRPGSLAHAFNRAREAGIDAKALRDFFDHALVSPVLTAHPTEVRRKSTLTRELEIAALLDARERQVGDDAELARSEEQLRRAILLLWRTNMLRQTRLKVIDEVANGALLLRLHVLPRIAAHPCARSRTNWRAWSRKRAHKRDRLVPARRLVDRRRPRRQPLRHRRGARRGDAAAERARAAVIISRSCTSWAANCRSAPR